MNATTSFLALNFNLKSEYTRRLWKSRFRLPIKVFNTKLKAWKFSALNQGMMFRDRYEIQELELALAFLKSNDTVLELGSGIGFLTNELARLAHKGFVHSFEANPKMQIIANDTLRLNRTKNAKIYSGVLGETKGETAFYVHDDFELSSLIRGSSSNSIEVSVTPIGEILRTINPSVIVVDIEGGEYELLQSPIILLTESVRVFIIEFHPVENLADRLIQLGAFFNVYQPSISLRELTRELKEGPVSIVATKASSETLGHL